MKASTDEPYRSRPVSPADGDDSLSPLHDPVDEADLGGDQDEADDVEADYVDDDEVDERPRVSRLVVIMLAVMAVIVLGLGTAAVLVAVNRGHSTGAGAPGAPIDLQAIGEDYGLRDAAGRLDEAVRQGRALIDLTGDEGSTAERAVNDAIAEGQTCLDDITGAKAPAPEQAKDLADRAGRATGWLTSAMEAFDPTLTDLALALSDNRAVRVGLDAALIEATEVRDTTQDEIADQAAWSELDAAIGVATSFQSNLPATVDANDLRGNTDQAHLQIAALGSASDTARTSHDVWTYQNFDGADANRPTSGVVEGEFGPIAVRDLLALSFPHGSEGCGLAATLSGDAETDWQALVRDSVPQSNQPMAFSASGDENQVELRVFYCDN